MLDAADYHHLERVLSTLAHEVSGTAWRAAHSLAAFEAIGRELRGAALDLERARDEVAHARVQAAAP
jgi:hypothetical protein